MFDGRGILVYLETISINEVVNNKNTPAVNAMFLSNIISFLDIFWLFVNGLNLIIRNIPT
jgi:hypothetical protein